MRLYLNGQPFLLPGKARAYVPTATLPRAPSELVWVVLASPTHAMAKSARRELIHIRSEKASDVV